MSRHSVSTTGLALIREYEGFQAQPARLPDGNWVVGHGHVRVGEPGEAVNENEAADLLALDIAPVELFVNDNVGRDLTQSQFDALVSFTYSIGPDAFVKSDVLRRINAGNDTAAACAMDAWRKAEVNGDQLVIDGLVRRRAAEKALYLKDLPHDATPSVFMRAKLDYAAAVLGAPVKHAPAPEVGSIPVAEPQPEPTERLGEILKSEPATEALLLTQVVANDVGPVEEDHEITTGHAKPVSRVVSEGRDSLIRVSEQAAVQTQKRARPARRSGNPSDLFGLTALTLFGVGLVGLGGWAYLSGAGDIVDTMMGAALAIPGVAALLFGMVGFMRRPAYA